MCAHVNMIGTRPMLEVYKVQHPDELAEFLLANKT